MENSSINFAESEADHTLLEDQLSDFNIHAAGPKEPGDEDEEEEGDEEDVDEEVEEESGDADNPQHDPDVVNSPVTTQTGGTPKRT